MSLYFMAQRWYYASMAEPAVDWHDFTTSLPVQVAARVLFPRWKCRVLTNTRMLVERRHALRCQEVICAKRADVEAMLTYWRTHNASALKRNRP